MFSQIGIFPFAQVLFILEEMKMGANGGAVPASSLREDWTASMHTTKNSNMVSVTQVSESLSERLTYRDEYA